METGRGLLGSRSENILEVPSSRLEPPKMLKLRRLLVPAFRAGAGALPSAASLAEFREKRLGTQEPEDMLIRRGRSATSGSSVERGNDWLWPCLRLPKTGPSTSVLPRALGKVNMFPKPL